MLAYRRLSSFLLCCSGKSGEMHTGEDGKRWIQLEDGQRCEGSARRGHADVWYSRIHGHGGESGVDVFVQCVIRVAREQLGRVELVLTAELLRREAVMLPYFVQVRLGCNHHTGRLAVYEVLLPKTTDKRSQSDGKYCFVTSDQLHPSILAHTLYTLAQYSKDRGLLMSYTRQTTSQARSASDRKSKSGITSWSWSCADRPGNREWVNIW